jgi:hypothetical protein
MAIGFTPDSTPTYRPLPSGDSPKAGASKFETVRELFCNLGDNVGKAWQFAEGKLRGAEGWLKEMSTPAGREARKARQTQNVLDLIVQKYQLDPRTAMNAFHSSKVTGISKNFVMSKAQFDSVIANAQIISDRDIDTEELTITRDVKNSDNTDWQAVTKQKYSDALRTISEESVIENALLQALDGDKVLNRDSLQVFNRLIAEAGKNDSELNNF